MMKKYDQSVEIKHNANWPYIPDNPYRILIIGGSGSEKTNALLNLIKNQRPDIDRIFLYVKDPFESKYQLLFNGRKKVGIEILKNPKAFLDYSQNENLEEYNPTNKRRMLIAFDDMTAHMESNKKVSPTVTELFSRGRRLNISLVFISQYYFQVAKTIRLNATHYFIMNIPNFSK